MFCSIFSLSSITISSTLQPSSSVSAQGTAQQPLGTAAAGNTASQLVPKPDSWSSLLESLTQKRKSKKRKGSEILKSGKRRLVLLDSDTEPER
ncbi:hypothetical protein TNIN_404251 [Trichonephila inaurata madagascariensis]|uniref:Uncharacterized protein n=1 Tax=Trichonephila inaurata madagascariensis TaxID=2747483 RepID=A0A8X6M9F3_9ARAC|nr:hypothetical protein TNIN_404251 [Trichonephila inaurata madagascariensis]